MLYYAIMIKRNFVEQKKMSSLVYFQVHSKAEGARRKGYLDVTTLY